jgi:hypothetical protein
MAKIPLGRLRAVTAAGLVISGLSALPAYATIPSHSATSDSPAVASTADSPSSAAVILPSRVLPARTLVDSVGVGVHLTKRGSSYANYPAVKRALLALGIHHIRDGISWQASKYLDLNRAGIKTLGTVSRRASSEARLNQAIKNAVKWRPALSSIGGPNEFETTVSDLVPKLRSFQSRLFTKVNANPALRHLPVLAPSLRTATNERLLGNIGRFLDFGAVHAYPYGKQPEELADDYLREARVTSGLKPIVVTETGMSNANGAIQRQHRLAYSERAAGIYTPRLVMEFFRLGVKRTYLYQLLNEDNVRGLMAKNRYFGLLHKDFSPKPAYLSMKTLLRTLADPGGRFIARPLAYSVSAPKALRRLTFQKRDGTYYIALWNPVAVWSGGPLGHDLRPAPVRATLNLPFAARSVQVIDTSRGPTPVKTVRGSAHVRLDVMPSVQLVKVTR